MDARSRGLTYLTGGGVALAAMLLLAACGSGTPAGSASPAPSSAAGSTAAAAGASGSVTVRVAQGPLGGYLTDSSGRAVYEFASDSVARSTCTGSCLAYWPALASTGMPAAGNGVSAAKLTVFTRSDGGHQVAYAGHPLYYFALDKSSGDTLGQGLDNFGAKWWLMSPSGQPITVADAGSSAPASSGGGGYTGGGYGR